MHTRHLRICLFFILLPSSFILTGCNVLGIAARALPPRTIKPNYTALAGQSIAVMVWTDRAIVTDFPPINIDTANAIQSRLQAGADPKAKKKVRELAGATFPVLPASIVRYQREHPEIEMMSMEEVAPRFGVSRLIFIEVEDFTTHAGTSTDMYRGAMAGTMKIYEVNGETAKLAYEENGIRVVYPTSATSEGVPGTGQDFEYRIYRGTLGEFADAIYRRLTSYQEED